MRVAASDVPDELERFLSDAGSGNPKSIVEYIWPLVHGYATSTDWVPPMVAAEGGAMTSTAIELAEEEPRVRILHPLERCALPARTVGYVEQEYELLPVHLQYVLRVACNFPDGVPISVLQQLFPASKRLSLRRWLRDLVERGILQHVSVSVASAQHRRALRALDRGSTSLYVFTHQLQQRLVFQRLVETQKEIYRRETRTAMIKCRWLRVRQYARDLATSRAHLERAGVQVVLHRRSRLRDALNMCRRWVSQDEEAGASHGWWLLTGATLGFVARKYVAAT